MSELRMEYIIAGTFLDVHLMFLTLEVLVREQNREGSLDYFYYGK